MTTLSRRSLLRGATALAGASALAACTVTTNGDVTAIVLDVAKVKNYGQAGLNAAATVTAFAAQFPAIAPFVPAITAAETALSGALQAFSDQAGTTLTITYNSATWQTRVDSILTDLSGVGSAIQAAIAGAGSGLSSTVQSDATTALGALNTVVSLFEALLGSPASVGVRAGGVQMTEAQALRILGVSR